MRNVFRVHDYASMLCLVKLEFDRYSMDSGTVYIHFHYKPNPLGNLLRVKFPHSPVSGSVRGRNRCPRVLRTSNK